MKVISLNANGIRSAARKEFFDWMLKQKPDVVCLQETKAQEHQLDDAVFRPRGYHAYFHDAEKKGYSGVAIYSRQKPVEVNHGIGIPKFDEEGRIAVGFAVIELNLLLAEAGADEQQRGDEG